MVNLTNWLVEVKFSFSTCFLMNSCSLLYDMFCKTQNIALNLAVAVGGDYVNNPNPASIVTGSMQVDWEKCLRVIK